MEPPDPHAPGPFRLSDPDELRRLLTEAGLRVEVLEDVPLLWRADSLDTWWEAVTDLSRMLGPGGFDAARDMLEERWGRVVNVGSILSSVGLEERTPYTSAKGAVIQMTRTLALEWASSGITVNCVCPGPFGTEMNRPLMNDPEKYAAFVSKVPMRRFGSLDEIGPAVLFLASEASSFVTGSALYVDGGWTAQ
jgi:NAD(P)-dependent dehydrogenase (short-subunit alcohol dehydrogenase family)